jgi:TetR/AcrR family transcriptional regulator, transcriptional repressor for nem operon
MPWPKEHKRRTRQRIVEAAAAAFRQHGIDQIGVADIMRRAGLTHGGFYAHFASKDDLLSAALAHASIQANNMLATLKNDDASSDRLLNAALTYLGSAHLTHPERGCPIPSLGPELTRHSQKARTTLASEIRRRLKTLGDLMPPSLPLETRNRQVAGVLACMIGGLIVARGLKETEGQEFLNHCRDFLREALANSDPKTSATSAMLCPSSGPHRSVRRMSAQERRLTPSEPLPQKRDDGKPNR